MLVLMENPQRRENSSFTIPVNDHSISSWKPSYYKGFPSTHPEYQATRKVAYILVNPIGILINLDNVQDKKQALKDWKIQMEVCFANNDS